MGFILKEIETYLHVKLTDEGRRKIAEGNFNPSKFSVGDSEIDYNFFKKNEYVLEDSMVLNPYDRNPNIKHIIPALIEDIILKYNIDSIFTNEKIIEKVMPELGFFDGGIFDSSLKITKEFVKQPHIQINSNQLNTDNNTTLEISITDQFGSINNEINIGDYILVGWSNQFINNNDFKQGIINPNKPLPYLWYKIMEIEGILELNNVVVKVDRDLPNFGLTPNGISYGYIFPKSNSTHDYYNTNNIREYWESGFFDFTDTDNTPPRDPSIWNMNILFTERIIGLTTNLRDNKYFNSSSYAGFINYIYEEGYKYKNIGIIHFTNIYPNNDFGEKLIPETIEIILPTIISNNNTTNQIGIKLVSGNTLKTMSNGFVKYHDLIDGDYIYGKIFHELKVIIIEDQELLFAMSYKSNRNWTYPNQINNFNIGFGC